MIYAMYMRYYSAYSEECDSLEEAIQYLESGEDEGELSTIGIFDDVTNTAYYHQYRSAPEVSAGVKKLFDKIPTRFEKYNVL